MIDIVEAMNDPELFGAWFAGESWNGWRAIIRAAFSLPMGDSDRVFFGNVAGTRNLPATRVKELWIAAGRRAGKDSVASLLVAFIAATFDGADRLRPGERPLCLLLATDREQAKIALRFVRAYFEQIPPLKAMVTRETQNGLELSNGVDIFVGVNSFRAVRGRTVLCAVLDECSFWRSEDSASPDRETYRALKPGMATLPESMLIAISSPYRRSGLLYSKFKAHFGADGDDVLFIKAPSMKLNPTLDSAEIERAMADDPAAARSEWLAEWRDDVSSFVGVELVESLVDDGVVSRPAEPGKRYFAFADPASGTGKDAFAVSVAHRDGELIIIDLAHEIRPPFSPESAIGECAALLRAFGVTIAFGDKYAPGFVQEAFRRHGVVYRYTDRDRSALYLDALPLMTSGRVRLPDNRRLVMQFANLERRAAASGKDRVDHARDQHDDLSNAVAGAICTTQGSAMFANPITRFSWA